MVTIVDPSKFTRTVSSGEMGVVKVDTRGAAGDGGAGVLRTGASLLGEAVNLIKTKDDADRKNRYDSASVDAAIALNSEANNYNDDPDFTTIHERASKSISEKMTKISEGITNPHDRELFLQNQKLEVAKTTEHLKGVAFTKERDHSRATIDTQLSDLRNVALTGDMGQASELVSRRLESAVDKGYFSAEEAADIKLKWQTSAASGRLSIMPPDQQLDALKQPWAEKLPLDERVKLQRAAEDQLVIGKAQAVSDELMGKNLSLDAGMSEIQKKIKDPKERQAAEERFKLEYTVAKQAKQDNQDELHNKYSIMVDKGLTIDEIKAKHSNEWEMMRPTQRENLITMEKQKTAPRASSDPVALGRAIELSASGRHDDLIKLISNNPSAFSKEDREQYLTAAAKGKAVKNVSDQELLLAKIPDKGKKPQRDKMLVEMNQWRNDFVQTQGKDPTPEQSEKQVDRLLMKYDRDPNGWGFGDTKPVWQYEHEGQVKALDAVHRQELKDEDPENYNDTEQYVKDRGLKLDRYQFEDAYKTQQRITSIKRLDPDGYNDVMDYFNPNRDLPDAKFITPSHNDFLKAYRLILERRHAAE